MMLCTIIELVFEVEAELFSDIRKQKISDVFCLICFFKMSSILGKSVRKETPQFYQTHVPRLVPAVTCAAVLFCAEEARYFGCVHLSVLSADKVCLKCDLMCLVLLSFWTYWFQSACFQHLST